MVFFTKQKILNIFHNYYLKHELHAFKKYNFRKLFSLSKILSNFIEYLLMCLRNFYDSENLSLNKNSFIFFHKSLKLLPYPSNIIFKFPDNSLICYSSDFNFSSWVRILVSIKVRTSRYLLILSDNYFAFVDRIPWISSSLVSLTARITPSCSWSSSHSGQI